MTKDSHPLRKYRRERAMSLSDMAALVGVSIATLSRVESGQNASADLMRRIAEATGGAVTPNDMLGVRPSEAA